MFVTALAVLESTGKHSNGSARVYWETLKASFSMLLNNEANRAISYTSLKLLSSSKIMSLFFPKLLSESLP